MHERKIFSLMGALCAALVVGIPVFADTDEDRVLAEARARAERAQVEADQAEAEAEAAAADAEALEEALERDRGASDDSNDVFLPIALSVLPGPPLPGMTVDAGIAAGLILSVVDDVYGAQLSSIGSIATGDMNGFQGAGIFNTTGSNLFGGQGAGIFNITERDVSGIQGAGIFNIAGRNLSGIQSAGIFNIAKNGGLAQIAGIFNIAEGSFTGLQNAGIFNIAEDMNGVQNAGLFNIAHDVEGVQVAGIINVARKVNGLQIGLINVSDTMYGIPIGLINIVKNGIFDTGIWFEDSDWEYVFVQKGSTNFYTLMFAGAPSDEWFVSTDTLAGGVGVGYRLGGFRGRSVAIDLDVSAKALIDINRAEKFIIDEEEYIPDFFPSARVSVRIPLFLGLALHGGIVLDTDIKTGPQVSEPFRSGSPWSASSFGYNFTFHPKYFIGISY